MTISGRHFGDDANVIVDGRRVSASVNVGDGEKVMVNLPTLPSVGMHLLQVQDPDGLFSNDFIFHVAENVEAAANLKRRTDREHVDWRTALARAISEGNVDETKNLRRRGVPINQRRPGGSSIPLSIAARSGQTEIVKYLLMHRANVNATNRDGSTPVHTAAYFCRTEILMLLLKNGGSLLTKNKRGETPISIVSAPWSKEIADRYTAIGRILRLDLDLKRIEQERPKIVQLLQKNAAQSK
jgi:hypothetical protein